MPNDLGEQAREPRGTGLRTLTPVGGTVRSTAPQGMGESPVIEDIRIEG